MRPGSGVRPVSNTGMRPGTTRIGTGMRQGTSFGGGDGIAGIGGSLQTQVTVERGQTAMLEAGMQRTRGGTGTGTLGTSHGRPREVADRSYFIGLIRPKVADLMSEIERLRREEQDISKNSSVLMQLQGKQKNLTDEIGQLKGQLQDVNLAVDKFNASADASSIKEDAEALKLSNVESRKAVDKLFIANKTALDAIKKEQVTLEGELKELDEQMKKKDPTIYAKYINTRKEAFHVGDCVIQQQQEIKQLDAKIEVAKIALNRDPEKKAAASLIVEILKKRQSRDKMVRECSLSVEDERQMLLKQAKQIGNDLEVLKRQGIEAKDTLQDTRQRLTNIEEELKGYSGDNVRRFRELQERDQEMNAFMDQFQTSELEELQRIKEKEDNMTNILNNMSRKLILKKNMPTNRGPLNNLTDELDSRRGDVEDSKKTHERLRVQLQERKEELLKVESLDEKIAVELQAIAAKVDEQQNEITKYVDLDRLRRNVEEQKKHLEATRASLMTQRDSAKTHIIFLNKQVEDARNILHEDQTHQSLTSNEQKLRMTWQSAFALEDFVRYKEKESHYNGMKADCVRMVEDINAMLKEQRKDIAGVTMKM